jgi:hypothetical protein
MTQQPEWVPQEIGLTRPSAARVCDDDPWGYLAPWRPGTVAEAPGTERFPGRAGVARTS